MEQTIFYYLRDNQNRPLITVCLHKINGAICRGIAICSDKDNPSKKTGKTIAFGRAMRARKSKKESEIINRKEADIYKSSNDPVFTEFEVKLLC